MTKKKAMEIAQKVADELHAKMMEQKPASKKAHRFANAWEGAALVVHRLRTAK